MPLRSRPANRRKLRQSGACGASSDQVAPQHQQPHHHLRRRAGPTPLRDLPTVSLASTTAAMGKSMCRSSTCSGSPDPIQLGGTVFGHKLMTETHAIKGPNVPMIADIEVFRSARKSRDRGSIGTGSFQQVLKPQVTNESTLDPPSCGRDLRRSYRKRQRHAFRNANPAPVASAS
ncbi:hypothetical protein [Pseudoxanthomonas mexicana]